MTVWVPTDDGHADLSNPDSFVSGPPLNTFARMRREDPVAWCEYPEGKGYWSITRYEDIAMLNRDVTPVVPRWGSIGAGDLGLLAHIALVMIGRGAAVREGRVMPGSDALKAADLTPVVLGPKDGLALCNGNALSAGMAGLALHAARHELVVAAHERLVARPGQP